MILETQEQKNNLKTEVDNLVVDFLERVAYSIEPNIIFIDAIVFIEFVIRTKGLPEESTKKFGKEADLDSWKWISSFVKEPMKVVLCYDEIMKNKLFLGYMI